MNLWIVSQMLIDLVLIVLILIFLRNSVSKISCNELKKTSKQVIEMIEPLLKEAESAAETFGEQLKEKNRLINNLNESLDTRIISLNLLLNRSESYLSQGSVESLNHRNHVYDQQASILKLSRKGVDAETIAKKLSMPRGEVDLVMDLQNKFLNIKQNNG